jgi:hypothetical protein
MRLSAVRSFDSEIAVRVAGLNGPEGRWSAQSPWMPGRNIDIK